MLKQEPDNPFRSPATSSDAVEVDQPGKGDDLGVATAKAAIRWFLICGISAIPSWVLAPGETTAFYGGMATGVLIFAVGYTFLDVRTRKHPLRQKPEIKMTLAITYGTRIAISLLFPVGFFVDIWCGIVALSATGLFFQSIAIEPAEMQFTHALLTTLIQGVLLNAVLAVYGLIVYAGCRAYVANKSASIK